MAETTSITDISKQLNAASRLVLTTDWFWVLAADGSSVRIPAEFVRAYLVENVKPTVGDDGTWYVDGKSTGVKASGNTPKLRGGLTGIDASYDNGQTWTQVVAYSDINVDVAALEAAYKKVTDSEAARVEAENARIDTEKKRVDAETARVNAEKQRETEFSSAKSACETAAASANAAADNANTATTSANNAIQSAIETATDQATQNVKEAVSDVIEQAKAATTSAKEVVDAANDGGLVKPTEMTLTYPSRITITNKEPAKITATMKPSTAMPNLLFLGDNNAVTVMPDGTLYPQHAGKSLIHVIPTQNTQLFQSIIIEVIPQVILLENKGIRLTSNGNMLLS